MEMAIQASNVRSHFSEFTDQVIHQRPQFVIRNNRDVFMAISIEHLKPLVTQAVPALEYEIDNESKNFVGTLHPLGLVAEAPSLEELKLNMSRQAINYAKEFMDDFPVFMSATNTRQHFPFILNILLQETAERLAQSIDAKLERA